MARARKVKGGTRFEYDLTLRRVEFEPNRSDIHLYDTLAHPALPLNSFFSCLNSFVQDLYLVKKIGFAVVKFPMTSYFK